MFFFQDSLIQPITKILLGVATITLLIVLIMKETPQWFKKFNITGMSIPPWVLACAVIVFSRMRKRTRDFFKKRGSVITRPWSPHNVGFPQILVSYFLVLTLTDLRVILNISVHKVIVFMCDKLCDHFLFVWLILKYDG